MPNKEEIKIFFSWQSSIDINSNANFIRHALKKAKDEIEKNNNNILLTLDEATRDMPGSPNIAEAIKNKISLSQIVISDLTIIDGKEERLSFPNPNVMFELGYAVAEIGWNRIIVLMNKKYGHKAEKLPFDVNGQRVSPFNSDDNPKRLVDLLVVAIEAIINHDPKTPQQLRGVTKETILYEQDTKSIEELFSYIHIPTIELFINDLPNILHHDSFTCWESFRSLMESDSFHIHDKVIDELLDRIFIEWGEIYTAGLSHYEDIQNGMDLVFRKNLIHSSESAKKDWNLIDGNAKNLKKSFSDLIKKVRSDYIQVDLREAAKRAWNDITANRPSFPNI